MVPPKPPKERDPENLEHYEEGGPLSPLKGAIGMYGILDLGFRVQGLGFRISRVQGGS